MMYEQQIRQQIRMDPIRRSRSMPIQQQGEEKAKTQFDVLDLSGMSLDSLPNPSINLALIRKLDLSNNNLQVRTYKLQFYIFQYICHSFDE